LHNGKYLETDHTYTYTYPDANAHPHADCDPDTYAHAYRSGDCPNKSGRSRVQR
jgi:hypothetical protein